MTYPQVATFPAHAHAGPRDALSGGSTQTPLGDSTVAIYALTCPKTGEVRYVGKARDPHKRYAQHLTERGRLPRQRWVDKCMHEGRAPGMKVLEWVPAAEWEDHERRIIAAHRSPSLLNLAEGGNQPKSTPEQLKRAGSALSARIRDDAVFGGLTRFLQSLGRNYKLLKAEYPERSRQYDERFARIKIAVKSNPQLSYSKLLTIPRFAKAMVRP